MTEEMIEVGERKPHGGVLRRVSMLETTDGKQFHPACSFDAERHQRKLNLEAFLEEHYVPEDAHEHDPVEILECVALHLDKFTKLLEVGE